MFEQTSQGSRSLSLASDSEDDVSRSSPIPDAQIHYELAPKSYTRKIFPFEYELCASSSSGCKPDGFATVKPSEVARVYEADMMRRSATMTSDYDRLKAQCEKAMTELQSLKLQHGEAVKLRNHAIKKMDAMQKELSSTVAEKKKTDGEFQIMKMTKEDLVNEKRTLEQQVMILQSQHDKDMQEMAEFRRQQREVLNGNGISESISEMYVSTFEKYDSLRKEHDLLQRRYTDLMGSHSLAVNRLESTSEENNRLNSLLHESAAIRSLEQAMCERNEFQNALALEKSKVISLQLHSKDFDQLQEEKNAVIREYNLVMSERDNVNGELEQLNDKLSSLSDRNESLEKEKRSLREHLEALNREMISAMNDRDRSIKERNEMCVDYGDVVCQKDMLQNQNDEFVKDYRMLAQERDVAQKERQEALMYTDRILKDSYIQKQKDRVEDLNQATMEIEKLRRHMDKYRLDLSDALQEAEIAKKRRDWAFGERDKIVAERESIRTLGDNLRRDRDRAVSDLAQALRDSDEVKKQRNDACKQLADIRERYDALLDKDARKHQLVSVGHNNSRDSAIDADLQEWETETLEIDMSGLDDTGFGFDLVGGKDDPQLPNDNSIFVSNVTKGSAADGKLKVNDLIIRVNNFDVTNVEKKTALQAACSANGLVNMVVRRRKSAPRIWQPIQLNLLCGKDLGIHIEQGMFISQISPTSPLAKDGTLCMGDRIITVNGQPVENTTPRDLRRRLEDRGESVVINVWRQTSPTGSVGPSPIPVNQHAVGSPPHAGRDKDAFGDERQMWYDNRVPSRCSGSQTDSLDSPSPSPWTSSDLQESKPRLGEQNIIGKLTPRNMRSQEETVLAEFEATLRPYEMATDCKPDKQIKKQKRTHFDDNGTWPYRGPPIENNESGTVTFTNKPFRRPPISNVINHDHVTSNEDWSAKYPSSAMSSHDQKNSDSQLKYPPIPTSTPTSHTRSANNLPFQPRLPFNPNNSHMDSYATISTGNAPPGFVRANDRGMRRRPDFRNYPSPDSAKPLEVNLFLSRTGLPISPTSDTPHHIGSEHGSTSRKVSSRYPQSVSPPTVNTGSLPVYTVSNHPINNRMGPTPRMRSPGLKKYGSQPSEASITRNSYPASNVPASPSNSWTESALDRLTPTPSEEEVAYYHRKQPSSPQSHVMVGDGSSTLPKRRPDIFPYNFPTNGRISAESVEIGRSSPMSPALPLDDQMSSSYSPIPSDMLSTRIRPAIGETRKVEFPRGAEPGFAIAYGPSGGIFVCQVHPSSAAYRKGLAVGDQLLDVANINMRKATYDLAAKVLNDCGEKISMLVQFNPKKYHDGGDSSSSLQSSHDSSSPLQRKGSAETITPTTSPPSSPLGPERKYKRSPEKDGSDARLIYAQKPNPNCSLGITLTGGNSVGIFVREVAKDSIIPEIRCGDQILKFNDIDLQSATAEAAAQELSKPTTDVKILTKHNIEKYNKIWNCPGDFFYIRVHFDIGENDRLLSFRKDDVLLVKNTLHDGKAGYWDAILLDDAGNRIRNGIIPSQQRLEDDVDLRRSLAESISQEEEMKTSARRGSGSARRSFFRRSKKHHRNNSKDSRELGSFSESSLSSDSVPILDDMLFVYTRVKKLECKKERPVILLAPFADPLINKLASESPDRYDRCHATHKYRSRQVMDDSQADGLILDYWQYEDHYECIEVAAIEDICKKNRHCLLSVRPSTIERLQKLHIYPIILFTKHKNAKQIRDVRDVRFCTDKMSNKTAKELFEHFQKMDQQYRHLFSDVINGGNLAEMCNQIKRVIAAHQKKMIWIPCV